jgi:hypothetical protein
MFVVEIREWVQINSLSPDDAQRAVREVIRNDWGEEADEGLKLTAAGRNKAQN